MIIDSKFVEGSFFEGLKPFTILFEDDLIPVNNVTMHQPSVIMEVPSLFPYTNNKMVNEIIIVIMCMRQPRQKFRALEA